jgi:protein-tyrosine phosphatase
VAEAAAVLGRGGIVGLPTETVYGLAASAGSEGAVRRLRALKDRPEGEPLPVQVADGDRVSELVEAVPLVARPLMHLYWPGPLTIVFPRGRLAMGGEGIGVRVPAHPVARSVLAAFGAPAAVPSCNPRGKPPAVDGAEVLQAFAGRIDLLLDGGATQIKEASTVIRVGGDGWELLREGLISREMIARAVDGRSYLFVCTGNTCRSPMAQYLCEHLFAVHLGLEPAELPDLGYRFLSAGTAVRRGRKASAGAREVMAELGLDLEGHRTRSLSSDLIRKAEAVVCMDSEGRSRVLELVPEAEGKTRLLTPVEIFDPVGGDTDQYRRTRDAIRESLVRLVRGR